MQDGRSETKLSSSEPTFAELATRLQALLVKSDPEIPPIKVPPPAPAAPPSSLNYSALLNQSMQQLAVAAAPLLRSPSCSSELSSRESVSSLAQAPLSLSRRSFSTSSTKSFHSEHSCLSESVVGEDATNWNDTWRSGASNSDSLRSESGRKFGHGSLHLTPGYKRPVRKTHTSPTGAEDLSNHVVDVAPVDPNHVVDVRASTDSEDST